MTAVKFLHPLPEWPTVNISMGSDPRLRASNVSGLSFLLDSSLRNLCQVSCVITSCEHTVSGPPLLLLLNCFFLLLAFPFRLVCLVKTSRLSPVGSVRVIWETVGAEPLRGHCRNRYVSSCEGSALEGLHWGSTFSSLSILAVKRKENWLNFIKMVKTIVVICQCRSVSQSVSLPVPQSLNLSLCL